MRRIAAILLLLSVAAPLGAQNRREALLEYQSRRRQAYAQFRDNYREACTEFMRKRWEAFRTEAPVPLPERKEPDSPVCKRPDDTSLPKEVRIPYGDIVDVPAREPSKPEGQEPAAAPRIDASRPCRFTFYGTECSVTLKPSDRIRLASLQEGSVADAWERIAGGPYDGAAAECADLKKRLRLNDWGYYKLVWTLGDAFCGAGTDESVLVQSFLMAEAGYKVRLARGDGRLRLLLALDGQVYEHPYFRIDGQTFYLLDGAARAGSYNICNFCIPGERELSMSMPDPPLLAYAPAATAVRNDKKGGIRTEVTPNGNLLDFMEDYPPCYWDVYAATNLSDGICDLLLPPLRRATAGLGEREAADVLLKYMHRAFPYKTDKAQFGRERTLFAEEMFRFPYSDCEDRSILFAQLVRRVLSLKTVLLYYPNHIATAVCFGGPVAGNYVEIDGRRYTVCDPTYIGADVGEVMPGMEGLAARIIRID